MRDKEGNYLTTKEFFERWKEGIQKITPLQQTKISLQGVLLVLVGVIIGLISTFMTAVWWLFIVLIGSLFLTSVNLIGTLQRYFALKKLDEEFKAMKGGIKNEEIRTSRNIWNSFCSYRGSNGFCYG